LSYCTASSSSAHDDEISVVIRRKAPTLSPEEVSAWYRDWRSQERRTKLKFEGQRKNQEGTVGLVYPLL
jgi:hypothetical protein